MPEKARVAVMLSGNGTTMSSLLFHSRLPDCPYEIVLVASNKPDASGLALAATEGVATFALSHKGKVYLLSGLRDGAAARPAALERILKLRRLRSQGLISDAEYQQQKGKVVP